MNNDAMVNLIFSQMEFLSEDKDRPDGERILLKTYVRELKSEFERLKQSQKCTDSQLNYWR